MRLLRELPGRNRPRRVQFCPEDGPRSGLPWECDLALGRAKVQRARIRTSRNQSKPQPERGGTEMTWLPDSKRYDTMVYRRCGRSGLLLPAISLGLWQNFGASRPLENSRAILRRAFDLGITHFDLANNYGPPYGSAEESFGRIFASDFQEPPRRARHLDQGGLRHVAGAVRRVGLAQIPAGQPRPEPAPDGPGLRGHLLLAPLRPGNAARRDDGCARHRRAPRKGPLRRYLLLLRRQYP